MSTRRRDARARRADDATTRDDDGGGGSKRRDDDDARRRGEARAAMDASRTTDGDALDALLRPRTTMAAASAARARMLATARDAGDASARGERDAATTCVALGVACELLPHCARACEEILANAAFDGVVGAVHAKTRGMEASETSAATRALEAIWRACPSTRERFDWSSATRWLRAESDEVRYNACALVALALGVSAKGLDAMRRATTRDDEAFHEYGARREARNLEFANARAMFWLHPGRVRANVESGGADDEDFLGDADLSRVDDFAAPADGYVRVGGVELRRRGDDDASSSGRDRKPPMIYTESARRNLAAVALALCRNRPVLLEGPAGCGKSAALEEVARVTGNGDFVTLHLDAQTDSKSLLGAYVCGAAPGEFKWQPGALTQAVTRGVWVLIEDVDLAPFEVLSALVPLLEKRRLYVPGRGESIQSRAWISTIWFDHHRGRTLDIGERGSAFRTVDARRRRAAARRRGDGDSLRLVSKFGAARAIDAGDSSPGAKFVRSRRRGRGRSRRSRGDFRARRHHSGGDERRRALRARCVWIRSSSE